MYSVSADCPVPCPWLRVRESWVNALASAVWTSAAVGQSTPSDTGVGVGEPPEPEQAPRTTKEARAMSRLRRITGPS